MVFTLSVVPRNVVSVSRLARLLGHSPADTVYGTPLVPQFFLLVEVRCVTARRSLSLCIRLRLSWSLSLCQSSCASQIKGTVDGYGAGVALLRHLALGNRGGNSFFLTL